jgi:AraC-like DNA-binding protein
VLSQGEIIFHRPNEFHSIRALDSNPNFFVLSFVSSSGAMKYFKKLNTVLDSNLKSILSSIIIEAEQTFEIHKNDPEIKKINKKFPATIGGEQLIKTYLEQFLIHLIRFLTEKKNISVFPTKENMENHLVSSMKRFVESKINGVFYISELCQEIGYSKSFLCKLFREQTGETIAAYSVKVKIKAARRLIREGNLNFAQISEELAFENPQYFCRVFKRVMGMTPSEFKASLQFKN